MGTAAREPVRLIPGAAAFHYVDMQGDRTKDMQVHTYLPAGLRASEARIVFVMHGHGRNAAAYRDAWIPHAEQHGFMVVAPLFDAQQWSDDAYAHASLIGPGDSRPRDPALWSFSVIEHLFDDIRAATNNPATHYLLYGHSEGGQFVHRLVLLLPQARYARAVAANPGWYTLPALDTRFPYGLQGTPVTEASLKTSLGRDLVVLLGDQDNDPNHPMLRRTPRAMAQGPHRLARGEYFMRSAARQAEALRCPLGWRVQRMAGAAHHNSEMAQAAADILASA